MNPRHILFIFLYVASLMGNSLNAIFPLYFLKSCGYDFAGFINFLIYRVNSSTSLMIMRLLGIKVHLYTRKNSKMTIQDLRKATGSIIISPNHIGEFDPLFVGCILSKLFPSNRQLQIFAKESTRWYPAVGWFLLASDALFVRYGNKRESNNNGKAYFVKQLQQDSHKDKTILIFPEGGINRPE